MATLRTNYKDDILDTSANLRRKYQVTENDDDTISLEDVTDYTQQGDVISASDINTINGQINTNTGNIATNTTNISNNTTAIGTLNNTTIPAINNEINTINNTSLPAKVNKPSSGYGSSGQVLKTNGDGTTYWDNEAGGGGSDNPIQSSNTTTFATNTITQTFTNGNTMVTTFNANGTITEVYTDTAAGTTTTSVTTFNNDGSISVLTTSV